MRRSRRSDGLIGLAVGMVAAAAFWPGILLTLEWVDQGQIVYPSWRAAHGALLYRDVRHVYGPSVFYWNAALLRLGGDDLLAVRLGLLAVKAAMAGLVFYLARRVARCGIALATAGLFIALWSAPFWIYATPYASHYTLLAGLGGLAVLLARPLGTPWTALVAGACFGLAATFKHTTGLFMQTGALVALCGVADGVHRPARAAWLAPLLRGGAVLLIVAYLSKNLRSPTAMVLAAAPLCGLAIESWRGRGGGGERPPLAALIGCGAGFVVPLLLWVIVYAWFGALGALVDGLVVLPQRFEWFVPLPAIGVSWLAVLATILAAWGVLVARRRGRIGDGATFALAIAAFAGWAVATRGFAPTLASTYLPIAIVAAAAPLALAPAAAAAARVLWWHGAFVLLSLYPAADLVHALMILPAVLPLLALVLERAWRLAMTPAARLLVVVLAAGPALAPVVTAVRSLAAAVATRSPVTGGIPRATGIWDRRPEFERMRRALAAVDRVAPPGTSLLVLPNAQLAYVLADRVSAVDGDEIVFYLVSVGALSPAEARDLLPEDRMTAAVETRRPVVLLWKPGVELERLRAAFPRLFELIQTRYRVAADVDGFRVLVPAAG